MRIHKAYSLKALESRTESLAREFVNLWIETGLMTADMQDKRQAVTEMFDSFVRRDIRLFAETGKYPKWAEQALQEAK